MVNVPQIQIPDFAATLFRGEQMQQSRLQALAAQRALDEAARYDGTLSEIAPALAEGQGPGYDSALARLAGAGRRGFETALPLLQQRQQRREYDQWTGQGAPVATPAVATPRVPGDPLTRIATVESGGDDAARNPRSSAAGRFQIIDSTWNQYAPRLGLRPDQRMEPAAQEQVARAIQADAQQAVGRPLRPGEAYGAHFLGIGGLRAFLGADPNADAQTVYAQAAGPQIAAQAFQRNPGLLAPGMTVGQVMAALDRRMGGGQAAAPGAAPAGDTVPAQNAAPAAAGGAPSRTGIDPAEMQRIQQGLASPNPMIQRAAQARLQMLQFQMRDGATPNMPAPIRLGDGPHGPAGVYRPRPDGTFERLGDVPPPNQTTVIQGDTVRGRADAAELTAVQASARDARQLMALFDRAERAVRATPEGQGAQLLPVVGQAARALGIDIAGTAEAEVLRSITNGLAVLQRAPGSGATTDFEMRLFMQAVPRLGNTREGNLRLIEMGRRLAQRRIEEAGIWRRHAGEPDLLDRIAALPAVFSEEEKQLLQQDATPVNNPGAGGPAPVPGATAALGPPPPPRVGEVRNGFRFSGGNPADQNSWAPVSAMPQGVP